MMYARYLLALLCVPHLACFDMSIAVAQEVDLVPVQNQVLASGYRAESLKFKPVMNDKRENIGRIDDFIFAKDEICLCRSRRRRTSSQWLTI